MSRRIRLLILGESGSRVRELSIPRVVLWLAAALPLVLVAVTVAAMLLLLTRGEQQATTQLSARPAPLIKQLARAALPKVERARQDPLCAPSMILVEGDFCPKVEQRCLRYVDPEGSVLRPLRCAEYEAPSRCLSAERPRLRFCIDRDEYAPRPRAKAANYQSFAKAERTCQAQGKRLCTDREWTFACEGEAMHPYPHGFRRDQNRCNVDRSDLVTSDGRLKDLRAEPGSYEQCTSPFGVRQLSGNVEEYVVTGPNRRPHRKGAYWQPGANHCRASQAHSDLEYASVETGFRCCADVK